MPSYVISASVYVDAVKNPEEATDAVERLNAYIVDILPADVSLQIVLPDRHDPGSSRWEESESDT